RRPVVLIVDTNYAFAGRRPLPIEEAVRETRTSCGEAAWTAIASIQRLLAGARAAAGGGPSSTGPRHAALPPGGGRGRGPLRHRRPPRRPLHDGRMGGKERPRRGRPPAR